MLNDAFVAFVVRVMSLLILSKIGPNTIEQVRDAVNSGIHCWVVQGSGRFADLMAKLCKNPNMDVLNDNIFQNIHSFKPEDLQSETKSCDEEERKKRADKKIHIRRNIEDKVAMYLAICRSPLLHVFDLEIDSFEGIISDLETMK
jgi:hypothetical protein